MKLSPGRPDSGWTSMSCSAVTLPPIVAVVSLRISPRSTPPARPKPEVYARFTAAPNVHGSVAAGDATRPRWFAGRAFPARGRPRRPAVDERGGVGVEDEEAERAREREREAAEVD